MSVMRRSRPSSTRARPRRSKIPAIPHMRAPLSEVDLYTGAERSESVFERQDPCELLVVSYPAQPEQSAQPKILARENRSAIGGSEVARPIGRCAVSIFQAICITAQPRRA